MGKLAPLLALATLGLAAVFAATGGACGSDACAKDTDCAMPLVCVASACVSIGGDGDATPPDVDVPSEADFAPEGDAGEDAGRTDADEGGGEAGDADGDGGGACTPAAAGRVTLEPGDAAAGGTDRPVVLASDAAFAYFGRSRGGPDPSDCLHFERIGIDGAPVPPATCAVTGLAGPVAVVALSRTVGFAAARALSAGPTSGIVVNIVAPDGTSDGAAVAVPGSDAASAEPVLAFDGTNIAVAWSQTVPGRVEIRAALLDGTTAAPRATVATTIANGAAGTKEPRIRWGESRFTAAYFDGTDGALHVLSLDGSLAVLATNVLRPATGESLVGYPALAWNGTVFGLVWETRGTTMARMHLATFRPGETPLDHEPLATTVPLSATEAGEIALAWSETANEWGVAWRRTQTGREGIALARIDVTGSSLKGEPYDVSPGSTAASAPSLAANLGTYLVAWIEEPTYALAVSCPP